ncbi:helix-turn-helix domain-containing protein [Haladaptatus sp. NG-SE-30]
MIIAELTLQTPLLETTLAAVPDMKVEVERERTAGNGDTIQLVFWASGDDHDRFESRMEDDPSISTFERLAEDEDRFLYRVTYADDISKMSAHPVWVELDAVLLKSVGSHSGWEVRFRFPDRDSFAKFVDWWRNRGGDITVDALYSPTDDFGGGTELTSLQRNTLRRALDAGYFEVPRQSTLDDLADEFNISSQALSVRLRRGTAALIRSSLEDESI